VQPTAMKAAKATTNAKIRVPIAIWGQGRVVQMLAHAEERCQA
jgi:hypothetical protein